MEELKKAAAYAIDELLKAGADKAQVSVSSGVGEEFNVDAGEFSLIRSVYSSGIAVKAIKDKKKGTASVNCIDKESVDSAVKECMISAEAGVPDDAVTIAALEENEDFVDGALKPDKAAFFDSLIRFTDDIKREFPQIMIEQLIASYSHGKHVFANSNGVLFTEEDGSYSVGVMYSAHDGDTATSFNSFDIDFLDPNTVIMDTDLPRIMFNRAIKELEAKSYEGKFRSTAVFSPSCLSDFISIIEGSFTGDFALIEGTSPWKDKLGQKVASDCFTLSVIPNDKRIVCGEKITSDGYKSRNFDIIKNGVLESFCLSEYAANRTGLTRAKSSSGAIEVLPGDTALEDIIKSIDKGILVCRFSGGEPSNNGDFSGVAKNSFLIENGKITDALTETMISGNFADMLNSIEAISRETITDGSCVLPYVAFGGVTVSGK